MYLFKRKAMRPICHHSPPSKSMESRQKERRFTRTIGMKIVINIPRHRDGKVSRNSRWKQLHYKIIFGSYQEFLDIFLEYCRCGSNIQWTIQQHIFKFVRRIPKKGKKNIQHVKMSQLSQQQTQGLFPYNLYTLSRWKARDRVGAMSC